MTADCSRIQETALAEFSALRAEILARQGFQHTIMALNLTLTGAIFGFALARPGQLLALLIVPLIAFMLCGRYITQDYGIEEIGRYIRKDLAKKVAGGLGWEDFIRGRRIAENRRLFYGLDPLFIAFPGVSIAAVLLSAGRVWAWPHGVSVQAALLAVSWCLDIFLTLLSVRHVWKTRSHFILMEWGRRNAASRGSS
jgi:uncharacterized membrane protein